MHALLVFAPRIKLTNLLLRRYVEQIGWIGQITRGPTERIRLLWKGNILSTFWCVCGSNLNEGFSELVRDLSTLMWEVIHIQTALKYLKFSNPRLMNAEAIASKIML